jgi:hypothetical protein
MMAVCSQGRGERRSLRMVGECGLCQHLAAVQVGVLRVPVLPIKAVATNSSARQKAGFLTVVRLYISMAFGWAQLEE